MSSVQVAFMTLPAYLALSLAKTALSAWGRGTSTGFRNYYCDFVGILYTCCYVTTLFRAFASAKWLRAYLLICVFSESSTEDLLNQQVLKMDNVTLLDEIFGPWTSKIWSSSRTATDYKIDLPNISLASLIYISTMFLRKIDVGLFEGHFNDFYGA